MYNAEIPLLLSEIDPVQNTAVAKAVSLPGFSEFTVWSGQPGGCGNPSTANSGNCYPPAVNYTPLYYLINGTGFNKTNPSLSLFSVSPSTGVTGTVLVRMVNAGLRMHVPAIVGSQIGAAVAPATVAPTGFSLIAEDGNPLPGVARIQNEVFMAAGKTYDVMINAPAAATALPIYDRELSLSGNKIARDAGMVAYVGINGAAAGNIPAAVTAVANPDTYNYLIAGKPLIVSDPGKGVIANDINVYGVHVVGTVAGLTLNTDGTFTYTGAPTTFTYCANGTVTGTTCSSGITASVSLAAPTNAASTINVGTKTYTSTVATSLSIKPSGVLSKLWDSCTPTLANPCHDADSNGFPLTVAMTTGNTPVASAGLTLTMDPNGDGGFTASIPTPCTVPAGCSHSFTYKAQNSQGTVSGTATVNIIFPTATGLVVKVVDGTDKVTSITDYRWVIEEDRTFYVDPSKTTNTTPVNGVNGCNTAIPSTCVVPTFGTNFHTSYMPLVATGCVGPTGAAVACESGQTVYDPVSGGHVSAVCDIGNGVCRPGAQQAPLDPRMVHLDPTKRYYISVLPGDAANSFENLNGCLGNATPSCGHGMGGAPIAAGQLAVTILAQPNPFPPSRLSVFVFEDDFPLNGEQDGGGGTGAVNSNNEPGLGQFNITLFDDAGGTGDATGQMTYDMFNQPLSNSLAGTIDPLSGKDACPISVSSLIGVDTSNGNAFGSASPTGITATIVTCPEFEADGTTPSPLAGQAIVANLMPGRYGVVATPGADRIAKGQEWLQTNTLDGQKAHDSFLRIGEPSFFQEYGPAGYHVSIGFANPGIINSRLAGVCAGTDATIGTSPIPCNNTVTGVVTTERMSRTPDERLYSSGDNSSFGFTQCYVSFGDPDGEDFAFTKCAGDGSFTLSGLPDGDWRVTVFDQWNDMLVDGLSTPTRLAGGATVNLGQLATNQWQANIYTSTFFDTNGNGIQDPGEPGLTLLPTNIRFRDGSYSNFNNTDLSGNAGFNEEFPLFSWYIVESDSTRYKSTGTHVVYDAGGPPDGTCSATTVPCGTSGNYLMMANTAEQIPLPTSPSNLRVPGARYCASADCPAGDNGGGSTGRVDPAWANTEGWQGFSGQNSFIDFAKAPFAPGETGGIHGEVIYASTRPFDDPGLLIHTSWTPDVPGVTINLYQEGTAPDGSQSLKLVDTTKTSSFDDWAQGFRSDGVPNMNCPGQGKNTGTDADLFFFTLFNQPMYLDVYNNAHGGPAVTQLPNNSQFKCFDGMHNWNQIQPAPYDGRYEFPSVTGINPTTGKPAGTNCTICVTNPATDPYYAGLPMLPAGKYVVEMILPPGYELVKEEDKNILIGDNYIAPITQEFGALGSVYILPDQAEVAPLYNANNAQNPTQTFGRTSLPSNEGDTGSVETFWPCVGASRIVPDYISLFPGSHEVAPFAGATRNLCDRKEVTLNAQASALAKFWVFTSAHVAAHFTGVITDDFTSEFDPFSPQFGEKFAPPNLPISIKDWTGAEVSRVYTDQWGTYNGLTYSTWEVNPPNPTGYAPTMMITCMNDPGTGPTPDPLYNPQYSQFCYEIPFMPGQTQYMDTPVTPTSAFAGAGYNNVDCAYPAGTPAIKEVDGDGVGPWVSASGHRLTITALGTQTVPNYAYSGPSAAAAPYNQKTISRDYGFGSTTGTVTIGGRTATISGGWSATQLTVTVPGNVPNCSVQQQAQYGGSTAQCGELVITRGDSHRQSIDAVTVTIGGKTPTHVAATDSVQSAIDTAKPGDLLMIDPTCTTTSTTGVVTAVACTTAGAVHSNSSHSEMLIMWKPVRLQGVGAASSIINANSHPSGKLQAWRERVNCLFGLALNGSPVTTTNSYDPTSAVSCPGTGWFGFNPTPINPQVDRLPLEAVVGWDAELNGNLAEQLQEPSLMGALEGAGITVLGKGVNFPSNPYDPTLLAGFPTGTTLLQNTVTSPAGAMCNVTPNPFPSNYSCNPSSIDGLGINNSSQGGGAIFVHGWGHNLEIANNRINNNSGTLSGGINVGQGEYPPAYIQGSTTNAAPGSCEESPVANTVLPYCHDVNVNIHNNDIALDSSTGDELFSATPAGAGGVSICTGSDYYKFNYNWVCGNLSTGDGGGLGHLGFSYDGDIEHNSILFNQSLNPTIPTNGGGIIVMGTPDADIVCNGNATIDQDCVPFNPATGTGNPQTTPVSGVGPSDGVGPGLVINANLIMGNAAEAGSGGGIAFQAVNGSDMVSFPSQPSQWNKVTVTNNIIADNVAGWDGGGISLVDSVNVNIVNNTVVSNSSTASSGMLFTTLGAPLASQAGANCTNASVTSSCPQIGGLVAIQNSAVLSANLAALTVTCPSGHPNCKSISSPKLENNIFWQNSSYYIGVGALGAGTLNQQNVVSLYNSFTTTLAPTQATTGACVARSFWDIGVRGDTSRAGGSGFTLATSYSVLTPGASPAATLAGSHNSTSNPNFISQYCDGSRTPPEFGASGWQVPPGISDATVPNPIFNLTPVATVDEGNNWVNMRWGPLSLLNPVTSTPTTNVVLGNYGLAAGSSAFGRIDFTATTNCTDAPALDFFNNAKKTGTSCASGTDAGAVEFLNGSAASSGSELTLLPSAVDFGSQGVRTTSADQDVVVVNSGNSPVTINNGNITITGTNANAFTRTNTCPASLGPGQSCIINVFFVAGTTAGPKSANLTVTAGGSTQTVALTGRSTVATVSFSAPAPLLTTTPATITAKTGTITVTNTATGANAGSFTLTANPTVTRTGVNHGTFTIAAGGTCVLGVAVAPGGTCTIAVTYTPANLNGTATSTAHVTIAGTGLTASPVNGPNFNGN
jgi:hypothetical protein